MAKVKRTPWEFAGRNEPEDRKPRLRISKRHPLRIEFKDKAGKVQVRTAMKAKDLEKILVLADKKHIEILSVRAKGK